MKHSIIIILVFCFVQCNAQSLSITQGNHFVCDGSPYLVLNNMDLNNNGSFISASSTVKFEGYSINAIAGDSITAFYSIELDKFGAELDLLSDAALQNEVIFINGLFDLNNQVFTFDSSALILNENEIDRFYGAAGYIETVKTMNMPTNFNIGNIGAEITSTQNLGLVTIIRGHQQQVTPTGYSIYRYYDIEPTNDSALNATLQFHYFDAELGGILENELDMWRFNGVFWELQFVGFLASDRDANSDWLLKANINEFSRWTLASPINNPLPVELLYFDLTCEGKQKSASWATASEINNDYFELQGSDNAVNWEIIHVEPGMGNSNEKVEYNVVINHHEFKYFRLVQVDYDGTSEVSKVNYINCFTEGNDDFIVYPNPAQNFISIDSRAIDVDPMYTIINNQAQIVHKFEGSKNESMILIDLSNLASGCYFIIHSQTGERAKFIKK